MMEVEGHTLLGPNQTINLPEQRAITIFFAIMVFFSSDLILAVHFSNLII